MECTTEFKYNQPTLFFLNTRNWKKSVGHTLSVKHVVQVRSAPDTHHVLQIAHLHGKLHATLPTSSSRSHGIVLHLISSTVARTRQRKHWSSNAAAPSNAKLVKPEFENDKHTHTNRICLYHYILKSWRLKRTNTLAVHLSPKGDEGHCLNHGNSSLSSVLVPRIPLTQGHFSELNIFNSCYHRLPASLPQAFIGMGYWTQLFT